ncbi:MAG: hypothetical protein ACMUIU_19415 [bacterium]
MLSGKDQDNYIKKLIERYNLIPISRQVKKRSDDLIHNINTPNFLIQELEKPLSELNINDLENRALILYLVLINPKRFEISKEKTKEIPDMILELTDYAREKLKLQELSGVKDKSFNKRKSVKFFIGLLVCLRNYLERNQIDMDI